MNKGWLWAYTHRWRTLGVEHKLAVRNHYKTSSRPVLPANTFALVQMLSVLLYPVPEFRVFLFDAICASPVQEGSVVCVKTLSTSIGSEQKL